MKTEGGSPLNLNPEPHAASDRRRLRGGAPIQIGLLGCGTVGGGVLRLLAENSGYLAERAGVPLVVKRVVVRDLEKERVSALDRGLLTTRAEEVVDDPTIDLVVEVMGGETPARALIERAIDRGKGVVTANKLLLAAHGPALLARAASRQVDLAFEGAVGGGIPIIRTLRDAFASDWVERVTAIVNGTCNYILTRMRDTGASFEAALREAQDLGYAEKPDPSLDVDGHDAAHKLIVLAMLAFGAQVDSGDVHTSGIRTIEEADHRYADRFGYTIKHLAIGRDLGDSIELRVHPTLIPKQSVLANVSGVLNAVLLEGRAVGPSLVYGRGAGDLPTAVSVVSDVLDVARSIASGVAGMQGRGMSIKPRRVRPLSEIVSRYYLRFAVEDRPGVMGRLAGALGDAGVSIEQIVQQGPTKASQGAAPAGGAAARESAVDVVLITHDAQEGLVRSALDAIAREEFLREPPHLFRIEEP